MKQKKLSFGIRFLLWAVSLLLSIALFASVIVTALVADVRVVTSRDNVRTFVVRLLTDPVQLHGRAPLRQGTGGIRVALPAAPARNIPRRDDTVSQGLGLAASLGFNLTEQMIDLFYDQLEGQLGEETTITKEELTDLVEQSTVTEFIANKAADLAADYVTGEITTTFEPEEIQTLIEENKELIETVIGEPLPEEVVTQIVETVKTNEVIQKVEEKGLAGVVEMASGGSDATTPEGEPILTPPSDNMLGEQLGSLLGGSTEEGGNKVADSIASATQTITKGELNGIRNVNDIVTLLRAATSVQNLSVCIAACVVLMVLILLVNIRQLGKGLRRCGYPLLMAGLMVIPCLLATYSPDMWSASPILTVVRDILAMVTGVNALVFGLGLLFVIAGIVVGCITKHKLSVAAKAALAAAAEAPVVAEPVAVEAEPVAVEAEPVAVAAEAEPAAAAEEIAAATPEQSE